MNLQRAFAVLMLTGVASLALMSGCEEWKNPGPRYPAKNTPEQSGMTHSQWHSTDGGAPTTQPAR